MKNYQAALLSHLGQYAKPRLGVFEEGKYKAKSYPHILPPRLRYLNFIESFRSELQAHLLANPSIRLHKYFHHLNSSQAFAFNFFFPYFAERGSVARELSATLGIDESVESWNFEHVQDKLEGTNVDVMWRVSDGARVFCEVKLSESGFGAAANDQRHRDKLNQIYRSRLEKLVSSKLLREDLFFKYYQLLRNISLLAENDRYVLVVLAPRRNDALGVQLNSVLEAVLPRVRARIKVAYVEDCLVKLRHNVQLPPELKIHAAQMAEKYIPATN